MKIYLSGHDEVFAAEQSAIMLLPSLVPRYAKGMPDDNDTDFIVSYWDENARRSRAVVTIDEKTCAAECGAADNSVPERRYAVKMALYRAATALTGEHPPWGALSGVRPAKLAEKYVGHGVGECADMLEERFALRRDKALLTAECAAFSENERSILPNNACIVYAGIPYCPTRCAYCSFVSKPGNDKTEISDYLEALTKELSRIADRINREGRVVTAFYVGGGTPTILTAEQLSNLCGTINSDFDMDKCREFTVESGRPDTITEEKLAVMREHGVTRICVNTQSLNDKALDKAGRGHTARQFYDAYTLAQRYGFSLNTDLIAGLEGETLQSFCDGLSHVAKLSPDNITVHALAKKRGADMEIRAEDRPAEAMIQEANRILREADYEPYYVYRQKNTADGMENTGWTKKGKASVYNILMMEELCSVFSAGSAGVTKVMRNGDFRRETNPKYPAEYILSQKTR